MHLVFPYKTKETFGTTWYIIDIVFWNSDKQYCLEMIQITWFPFYTSQLIGNPYAFLYLYYFLIRPVLKHTSTIWAHRTAKHRLQLKKIQHKLQRIQFRFIAYRIWCPKSSLDPDADLGHYLTWSPKNCFLLQDYSRTNHQSHPFFNLSILMQ